MASRRSSLVAVLVLSSMATVAVPSQAADRIVVRSRLDHIAGRTATYTSHHGRYTATWIGPRHYRLRGKIDGRQLSGTIRTHQSGGGNYRASGSGRLGRRSVSISGGGPNSLKRATLVLRPR